ncbi:NAD(+) diphosphatase [Thauera butanivorans]|uniref:NAD(+) diphosphatase n=1 Tax=Thauera butanivorans TaxID=86174 RepID=UPI000837C170|nr:NAD(+) diphosphatase [Thauera butanivorans]
MPMHAYDRSAAIGFGFNPLDRLSDKRQDEDYVYQARQAADTRFVVHGGDEPLLMQRGVECDALFSAPQLAALRAVLPPKLSEPVCEVFMGRLPNGAALFALDFGAGLVDVIAGLPGLALRSLRAVAMQGELDHALLGELGGAKAVLDWHRRHRFCAQCGAPSRMVAGGWRRDCDACGAQHFPRVDPVVIMLAIDGERCLLGRQPRFAAGMYSALAGFVEPGETIEDAVRREILEEAGVPCSTVRYFASQPWPFPSSLMIGCFAQAQDTAIIIDSTELDDARWFSRAEVAGMLAGTHAQGLSAPLPYAIAHHLMRAFVDEGEALLR